MISTKLIKVVFLLCFFIGLSAWAGDSPVRAFDTAEMKKYAASEEFAYMTYVVPPPSIWDQIKWFLLQLWYEFWQNPVTSRPTLYLFILVMFAIAAFYIIRMRFRKAMMNHSANVGEGVHLRIDDERINYPLLIEQALNQQDFKSAIRLLYLSGLAQLASKERIRLAEWKTPYDYQLELSGKSVPPYVKLSLLFEYVWYGDFDVKRADFDKGRNYLEMLQESIE